VLSQQRQALPVIGHRPGEVTLVPCHITQIAQRADNPEVVVVHPADMERLLVARPGLVQITKTVGGQTQMRQRHPGHGGSDARILDGRGDHESLVE
jgi:hypothetical protein